MPQQPTIQGPFTSEFNGLNFNNKAGGLGPNYSPVFHNCEVATDGTVRRRGGTRILTDTASTTRTWSISVKTRRGSEYLVTVNNAGITVTLYLTVNGQLTAFNTFTKTNVFNRALDEVYFLQTSAPYDKLLIFTGNHPIIQLSLIERSLTYTCTNGAAGTLTSPFGAKDAPTWNDNVAANYILLRPDLNTTLPVLSKSPGFNVTTSGGIFATSQVVTLTLVQCTWQWWAESLIWEGKDFAQGVSRVNVVPTDQNTRVPVDLITDLDPRYLTSPYIGLIAAKNSNYCAAGLFYTGPSNTPQLVDDYGFSNGGRYIYSATTPLNHAPFYVTTGTTEAAGVISHMHIIRQRELRFNANTGVLPGDLDVYVNDVKSTSWLLGCQVGALETDHLLFTDTYTTQRNWVSTPNTSTKATGLMFMAKGNTIAYNAVVVMTNNEVKWVGSNGRKVWYKAIPSGGGALDGCYVQAFGLGAFCDYDKGYFPQFGTLFRDRLVLRNHPAASDQLVLSGTADVYVPGEFYSFFQVTDALEGLTDDPFTINITSNSRESITALLGWQQSLFVFTNVSTYAVNGGEVFGPASYTTGLISSYGAFNQNCVIATNLTVLSMNRYGVFDLLNKNNTSDYGAFERSQSVKELFLSQLSDQFDSMPFLTLNDSTNTVMIGLPVEGDFTTCSRLLTLNLTWNAWATISSSVPFKVYSAAQLLDSTILVVSTVGNTRVLTLQYGTPIYLDYERRFIATFPLTASIPFQSIVRKQTLRGILELPVPTMPQLVEYNGSSLVKELLTYRSTNPADTFGLTPRNTMLDVPQLTAFLGTAPPSNLGPVVVVTQEDPFPFYVEPTVFTDTAVVNCTIPLPTGFGGAVATNNSTEKLTGVLYNSIYATPVFNLESLGRLKRLKRVHLVFNTEFTKKQPYGSTAAGTPRRTRMNNSAIVSYVYSYNESGAVVDSQLMTDVDGAAGNNIATERDTRGKVQISLPLQGYGCDYQVFVSSVGVDGFNLIGYEFDVKPANSKRHVRE
jgi:hypothetical protein